MKPKKLNFSEMKNALSRDEMKKIMAGSGGGGTACNSNSDCGSKTIKCSSGSITVTGYCYAEPGTSSKTCHYGGCPS